jgi:catechol 2,3-dioxygenase-like lactoylglutathione lyase family enzyme
MNPITGNCLTEKARSFYYIHMAAVPLIRVMRRPTQGLDHVTLTTGSYRRARDFYEQALRPLGFSIALDWPDGGRATFGLPFAASSIWIVEAEDSGRASLTLAAPDQAAVDGFFEAAVAAGGRPRLAPAFRAEYTPRTYAAEVVDPDGNAIEAVCWRVGPPPTSALHAA